jgi:pentatricopeptide repeat protein
LELQTRLINFYGKCGEVDEAHAIFLSVAQPDTVLWTALITAYEQNNKEQQAIRLFEQMQQQGVEPGDETYITVISACATMKAYDYGKKVHMQIIEKGLPLSTALQNTLIYFYGKCGEVDEARTIFDAASQRNTVMWSAMIAVHAQSGQGKEALALLEQMHQQGVPPNEVTLLNVLNACSHAGLVDEGKQCFDSMTTRFHITPTMVHYGALVDILARAGRLREAEQTIQAMPFTADDTVLKALLGGCRIHGDVETAKRVYDQLRAIVPSDASVYVLMGNIHSGKGDMRKAQQVRKEIEAKGLKKRAGMSQIVVEGKQHTFFPGPTNHPRKVEIDAKLDWMRKKLKEDGYTSDHRWVLREMPDEQKEEDLCRHSEKKALAFGLISTLPETVLRITKNLRMCGDCHEATKRLSKIVGRRIVVGDANRLHDFRDGSCSCRDYY